MKKLLLILLPLCFFYDSKAQGCVAIRNNGSMCTMDGHGEMNGDPDSKGWIVGLNSRYFKSYKHFVGKEEQKHRVENGTEVINYFFSTEIGINRQFNARWSAAMYVPVINNARSSMYEHYGNSSTNPNARRSTHSFGLGDIRFAAYYWVTNPAKRSKFSLQAGLGVKLPTGDYKYMDYFHRNDSVKVLGPVDQSIQLGDGGTGFTTEISAFYRIAKRLSLYANGYYLLNPREQNGVSTARGGTPSASSIAYTSDVMSVPDQYMYRVGINASAKKFTASAGVRMECIPAEDLVGGSHGFRRPGYVFSFEPVVTYRMKKGQLYLSVPYALVRNRTQSVPDKIRTDMTGEYAQGDAAFADYSINFGFAIPF